MEKEKSTRENRFACPGCGNTSFYAGVTKDNAGKLFIRMNCTKCNFAISVSSRASEEEILKIADSVNLIPGIAEAWRKRRSQQEE